MSSENNTFFEKKDLDFENINDFQDNIEYENKIIAWLNEEVVRQISKSNDEPKWTLDLRLKALKIFKEKELPKWWPSLEKLNLDEIYYFAKPVWASDYASWEEVPENLKKTFDKLWIPEAEKLYLSGVWAQYDSNVVYHNLKPKFKEKWVVFMDMNSALKDKKLEKIIEKYFSKSIPISDHKFSALHYAVWSWGTFLYVPKWVKVDEPLQSYFRMNKEAWWQFEHTIIILEEESEAHYIEWCSAPKYDRNSLHAGWVEIFVWKNAKMRYSSVENWSLDTYNLNTKRAIVEENWYMEWVSGNMWSGITMLYPCSVLKWNNASCNHLWVAFANWKQNQDTGAKVVHIWKNTSSNVVSKSLSKAGGISTFRWLIDIKENAVWSVAKVDCDWLILDEKSVNNAIPLLKVWNSFSTVAHEATAWKINEQDLFYLMSRWIWQDEATSMIVNWFISWIVKELPLEYASEMNVLVSMEFEGF